MKSRLSGSRGSQGCMANSGETSSHNKHEKMEHETLSRESTKSVLRYLVASSNEQENISRLKVRLRSSELLITEDASLTTQRV